MRHLHGALVVLALCCVLVGIVPAWARDNLTVAAGNGFETLPGQTPAPVADGSAPLLGSLSPATPLMLNITLPSRDPGGLRDYIAQFAARGVYLTERDYIDRFGAAAAQVAAVTSWLGGHGLRVVSISADGLSITISGSAGTVASAFRVGLNRYRRPNGTIYFANNRDPLVPAALNVSAVSGLSNWRTFHTFARPARVRAAGFPITGYTPADFRKTYNVANHPLNVFGDPYDGTHQNIAIVLWGKPLSNADLAAFAGSTGDPTISSGTGDSQVQWLPVNGGSVGTDFITQEEIALDTEYAHGLANHSHLKYYLAPDDCSSGCGGDIVGIEDALFAATHDTSTPVVSNSWGTNEPVTSQDSFVVSVESSLAAAAATGISVFFSTGDAGSASGGGQDVPQYPAGSPNAIAVGGTTLTTNTDFSFAGETGWSGSGGGCSLIFSRPVFQTSRVPNASCPGRVVPDLAAVGNPNTGAQVTFTDPGNTGAGPHSYIVGGTSLSAPIWAGMAADANRYALVNSKSGLGWAAPELYCLGSGSNYNSIFHDSTNGSNGDFTAAPGWDEVTGFGSVDWWQWVQATIGASLCAASPTPTTTPSPTISATPTATSSPTTSATPTRTLTATSTQTSVASATGSATGTATATSTPSATGSATSTSTPSATNSASRTATATITATPTQTPVQNGSLSGVFGAAPSTVNLTSQGSADWAHWGFHAGASLDRKLGVVPSISTLSMLHGGTPTSFSSNPTAFSWTDGTPNAVASTATGVYAGGLNQAFVVSLPADTSPRTVYIYVGVSNAVSQLTAQLSDGSAQPFIAAPLDAAPTFRSGVYTLTYRAASSGQTLSLSYALITDHGSGVITLCAVSLAGGAANTPTSTASVTSTSTSTPSSTSTPTSTPTPSSTGSATSSSTPAVTSTPTMTWTLTATPSSTSTIQGGAGSPTSSATSTSMPSQTATSTPTASATSTAAPSNTATTTAGSAVLSGVFGAAPNTVNVTLEGATDWIAWGTTSAASVERKQTGAPRISTYSPTGGATANRFSGSTTVLNWSDGNPVLAGSSTSGVYVIGPSHGLTFTTAADTTQRTLHIYLDVSKARAGITATLSGAAPYSDSSLDNATGFSVGEYSLTFKAASPGQTLTVALSMPVDHGSGVIALQGATLADSAGALPTATLTASPTATQTPSNTPTATAVAPSSTATSTATASATSTATATAVAGGTPGLITGFQTAAPGSVNLTNEGTTDWIQWGLGAARAMNHKAGVVPRISDFSVLGTVSLSAMNGSPTSLTWTDGTPTVAASTSTGAALTGQGNGFSITLPADTTTRTARFYVASLRARGQLLASIDDGVTKPILDSTFNNTGNLRTGMYTITYHAGSGGHSLTLTFTELQDYGSGAIAVQGASLS